MDLAAVMDEIATRLDTISGLRVFGHPPGSVTPPAAIVSYPDSYSFDETYGRGMDRMELPVLVMVGRPTDRSTRDRLAAFCDGSGSSSVKQVVESGSYAAFHTVRVDNVEFDVYRVGEVDYMTALFHMDIAGSGS